MTHIVRLTPQHKNLFNEYNHFLKKNNLSDLDILHVWFIYLNKSKNFNCFTYDPNITLEEIYMYNLTVGLDYEPILVANDNGIIYAQILTGEIYGFRCSSSSLKSPNNLKLTQWIVKKKNLLKKHYLLLKDKYFFS